ncbi:MAG: hypothetical protein WB698_07520 [Solirubrobacteraceae bacterium]
MKTPAQTASLLVAGTLERSRWPELDDEDFSAEVRARLTHVGLELVGAGGRWLARPAAVADEEEGFEPAFRLHSVELAMVAALYLHLRYLPLQAGQGLGATEEPSVEIDEVMRAFPGHQRNYLEQIVLGHLRNAGFVRRDRGRLYAGPYLAALNDVQAGERAQAALSSFQLRRYLRRRAEELEEGAVEGDGGGDASG